MDSLANLKRLGDMAGAFAKAYTRVKEQLMREGVPNHEASEVARSTALIVAMTGEPDTEPWAG